VNDERAGGGSALHGVNAGYSFGVEGVGAETVNSLGGEGDESAGAEKPGGVVDFAGIGGWGHINFRL
jgi:hypothetical protein